MPEQRVTLREMWWSRLQGCQREPVDNQRSWLKYTMLCRKLHVLQLSHKNLVTSSKFRDQLLEVIIPPTIFVYCQHLWGSSQQQRAFSQLHNFVK